PCSGQTSLLYTSRNMRALSFPTDSLYIRLNQILIDIDQINFCNQFTLFISCMTLKSYRMRGPYPTLIKGFGDFIRTPLRLTYDIRNYSRIHFTVIICSILLHDHRSIYRHHDTDRSQVWVDKLIVVRKTDQSAIRTPTMRMCPSPQRSRSIWSDYVPGIIMKCLQR